MTPEQANEDLKKQTAHLTRNDDRETVNERSAVIAALTAVKNGANLDQALNDLIAAQEEYREHYNRMPQQGDYASRHRTRHQQGQQQQQDGGWKRI